jgi:hypothetical protein
VSDFDARRAKATRRSFIASSSHAFRRYTNRDDLLWEERAALRGDQWDDRKAAFYAGFTEAWEDRQAALDRAFERMAEMSTQIRELERKTPTT